MGINDMSGADDVVHLAIQEATLQEAVRALPAAQPDDARRCLRFACECVLQTPTQQASPPIALVTQAACQSGFRLAKRWADGEAIPTDELQASWDAARRTAPTITSGMGGATAAQWAMLSVIEAALLAAAAGDDAAGLGRAAKAAAMAARYARLIDGRNSLKAVEFQKRKLDEIMGK